MTYRLGGHTFGSTTEYMDPAEMEQAEADEPVARYRRWLVEDRAVDGTSWRASTGRWSTRWMPHSPRRRPVSHPPADELLTDVFSSPEGLPR